MLATSLKVFKAAGYCEFCKRWTTMDAIPKDEPSDLGAHIIYCAGCNHAYSGSIVDIPGDKYPMIVWASEPRPATGLQAACRH